MSAPNSPRPNGNNQYLRLEDIAINVSRRKPVCQFKLLVFLSVILLLSWIVYSHYPNLVFYYSGDSTDELSIAAYDQFKYAKSSDDFYEPPSSTNRPPTGQINAPTNSTTEIESGNKRTKAKYLTECKLPNLDPWAPAIRDYLDPSYYINWKRDCKREYPELTKLINGYVVMHPEAKSNGTHCQFKCLYPHNDFEFVRGEWKEISEEPDCDVLETHCQHEKVANNTFYYNYLHAQVYRKLEWKESRKLKPETTTEKPETIDVVKNPNSGANNKGGRIRRAPDVHLFVIDSLSHAQLLRSMPKTVTWLRERMGAIAFPHMNKVALNSRPNSYALLLGIQAYPVEASPMGEGYQPERDLDKMGGIYLDHEPFVGFEYRAQNYRTMMAEDWGKGIFNWPRNYGFDKQPTEHYMRPFHLRTEPPYDVDKEMTKIMHDKSCMEAHHYIIQYLKDFIDAYDEQPKFSITWMVEIAHDTVNGPYRIDEEIYEFFRDYEQKLNNTFLFVMGDHGLRFTGIRSTKQGEIEDNNPAMYLVLPEHLRYNKQLMQNLRDNARQLTTHFDTHATLVNIARQGQDMTAHTPFDVLSPELKGPTPFGQSLLYPFDKTIPRNCDTLKIPFEFCQCQFEKRNVTNTQIELGKKLAGTIIERMNSEIAKKKVSDKCSQLHLHPTESVEVLEFEPDKKVDVFQVTILSDL